MRRRPTFRHLALTRLLVLAIAILLGLGCKPSPSPSPASSAALAKPYPSTVAEADTLRQGGASWTNEEIRVYYNKVVTTIGPSNERWKQEGLPAEERARRAFAVRHDARLTSRAMMSDRAEVELLRLRDQEKYGSPDGPTFDMLVEKAKKAGTTGDAVYDGIIASSQRTDEKFNEAFGVKRAP
jgi:hypothetical protein